MIEPVFVVAEAGVNHNGSLARALDMVKVAADAGANAIKFQTFKAERLVTVDASRAGYQQREVGSGSQYDMLKELELDEAAHYALADECANVGIEFMSTAFDVENLSFLIEKIGIQRIKIPSGEVTNPQLLFAAGHSSCPILLSTGMATLEEITGALGVLVFSASNSTDRPSEEAFLAAWRRDSDLLRKRVTLLQCTTAYPAPQDDINLRAMDTLRETFGLPAGFSDHSMGTAVAVAAVARDAKVIEKHFTLDRGLPGPDHSASLEPSELTRMIADIRVVEGALGTGEKSRRPSEIANIALARRGVYAARDIVSGETLSESDMVLLRPENGLSPMRLWEVMREPASRAYRRLDPMGD